MPARNSRKQYLENGFYHLYNRGVEKRIIFLDQQDYNVFLFYLKQYLLPKNEKELYEKLSNPSISYKERAEIIKLLRLNNFFEEITLLAYCLMPNHFHFFIKQKSAGSIDKLMNSLCTRYSMYFNAKYKRVGSLYQGVYKAVLVNHENQFLHLSRYIHQQAVALKGEAFQGKDQSSSLPDYLGKDNNEWIHPEEILAYFSKTNPTLSYESFITQDNDFSLIQELLLDD